MQRDSSIPADRGRLETERRLPESAAIDAMTIEQALRLINAQDMEVPKSVRKAIPAIEKLIDAAVGSLRAGGRMIYIGAGTSGRLGVLDASECPPTFFSDPDQIIGLIAGGDSALRRSSEGMEDDPQGADEQLKPLNLDARDLVVGIAAGGTTPYVWGALRFAGDRGAKTGLICCVPLLNLMTRPRAPVVAANRPAEAPPPPKLPARVDFPVELSVGPEVITGSTRMKAGTATKLVLNMLSTVTMIQLGKVWGNLMVDLRATNDKLKDRAVRILCSQCGINAAQALTLLEQADGRVKVALVMAKLNVEPDEAKRLLTNHLGRLRPVLGPPVY